jgi:hypothetical protein
MSIAMKKAIIGVSLFLTLLVCVAPAKNASEIKWSLGTLGQDKTNPDLYYSLLFVGFLRQQLSPECNTHMVAWLKEHPSAMVVPVAIDETFDNRNPKSKLIFVWIVDNQDNLGVELVRKGCVPATWLFALMPGLHLKASQKDFDRAKEQLLTAEKLAKTEKLGIWSAPQTDAARTDD